MPLLFPSYLYVNNQKEKRAIFQPTSQGLFTEAWERGGDYNGARNGSHPALASTSKLI